LVTAWSLLALPGGALAAGWLPAVPASPPPPTNTTVSSSQVAASAGGAQALVYTLEDTTPGGDGICFESDIISRTAGGDWSQPSSVDGCQTDLAMSPIDEVFATTFTPQGSVLIASGPAGGALGAAVEIYTATSGEYLGGRTLVFDAAGTPTVVYQVNGNSGGYRIVARTRQSDGSWDTEPITTSTDQPQPFAVAAAPDGHLAVVWGNNVQPDFSVPAVVSLESAWRDVGANTWTALPEVLAPTTQITSGLLLESDPQGRVTVMFRELVSGSPVVEARTLSTPPSPAWGSVETVPPPEPTSAMTVDDLAFDSAGNALAAGFSTSNADGDSVWFALRDAGTTTWISGHLFPAESGSTTTAHVGFDGADTASITFPWGTDKTTRYFSRALGALAFTERASPPTPTGSSAAETTTDADGYVTATWVGPDGIAYTSVFDPVAPDLTVSPPSSPTAGSSVGFTIAASDVWGPVTYTIDFGDGQTASGRAMQPAPPLARVTANPTVSHTYTTTGNYTATVTAQDGAANTRTTQVPVAVGSAPPQTTNTTVAPAAVDQVPTLPIVPGLPDPLIGQTVNIFPIKPPVLVKEPGKKKFVLLTTPKQVRVGSVIDTRKGRVRITIAGKTGRLDTADFYAGMFKVIQKRTGSGIASMVLNGGRFRGCPRAPRAQLSRKRSKSRSIRHLWGAGGGAFRTVGRYSSATIRGTTWLTDDRCNGTLTRVTVGKVGVRDFVKRRTVVVKARHRYFARPLRG
jgi:hypothetical protein